MNSAPGRLGGRHRAPSIVERGLSSLRRSGRTTVLVAASSGLVAAATIPAMATDRPADAPTEQPAAAPLVHIEAAAQPAQPAIPAVADVLGERASDIASRSSRSLKVAMPKAVAPEVILAQQTKALSGVAEPIAADSAVAAVPVFGGGLGFQGVTPEPEPEPEPVVVESDSSDESTSERESSDRESSDSGSRDRAPRESERKESPEPEPGPSRGGVIAIGQQYIGVPYVYGGSTPSGFDCSGFTSYVFRQVGVNLPRSARDQARAVTRVSDPRPGDLIFFNTPATHVGIYLGNGMMLDSPKPGLSVGYRSLKYRSNYYFGRP